MHTYRPLQWALLISLTIHAAVLTIFSVFHIKNLPQVTPKLQVAYVVPAQKKVQPQIQPPLKNETTFKEKDLKDDLDILSKKNDQSLRLNDEIRTMEKSRSDIQLGRKAAPQVRSFQDSNRIVTVPFFKSEKITNPKYLSYTDTIRQKIRQTAQRFYNSLDTKYKGKVYLAFVISRDGSLKDVRIIEARTQANDQLRQLALRSFRESSPFTPFPKDLDYPELSFNVELGFQVN